MHAMLKLSFAVAAAAVIAACASSPPVIVGLPERPAGKLLRVYVHPLLSDTVPKEVTPAEYRQNQFGAAARSLASRGLYEVVPEREIEMVVAKSGGRLLESEDPAVVRALASALWADYAFILDLNRPRRGAGRWNFTLINVASGREFPVSIIIPPGSTRADAAQLKQIALNRIFQLAKEDLLETAVNLSGASKAGRPNPAAPPRRTAPAQSVTLDLDQLEKDEAAMAARIPLVVNDLQAEGQNPVVSRILSEALRQELVALGRFRVVDRENMLAVVKEQELQLTGLIDDKEAVKMGKGLAARQLVVGSYAKLGATGILQTKRIDVENQGVLGAGKLQGALGAEADLLEAMPKLAKDLSVDR